MPDLHDLDQFNEGLPAMDLLPASEIRRRGDRMRRRRTGLVAAGSVLAVALAIGTPVIAFSGADEDLQPAPRPSQTDTVPHWLTEVFDDCPLTAGFPDPDAQPSDALANDPAVPATCGYFLGSTDNRVVAYQGESEDRAARYLVVYLDAATAKDQLAYFRNASSCPADSAGPLFQRTSSSTDVGTDEAWVFTEQVQQGDDLLSDLTLALVARTGNAIYVDMAYTSAGGNDVVRSVEELVTERSKEPLELLCVYAADPCLDP
jgi:hypothetical protein